MALPQGWPKRQVQFDVPEPGRFGQGEPASFRFITPMHWEALASRLTGRDARGRMVALRVVPAPEAMRVSVLADASGTVEGPVILSLPEGLVDVFGVQVRQPDGGFVLP